MIETCDGIIDVEKKWFLNQCWVLGADMDDDVMNQQKWAVIGFFLSSVILSAAGQGSLY